MEYHKNLHPPNMKLLSLIFLIQIHFAFGQDIVGKWQTESFPTFVYDYKQNDSLYFNWYNDIGSYGRNGTYRIEKDTIIIDYQPIIELNQIEEFQNDSMVIQDDWDEIIWNVSYKVYSKDSCYIVIPDSSETTIIPNISKVDSIYFGINRDFENPFFQIDMSIISSGLYNVKFQRQLMWLNIRTNTEKLLILSVDKIFMGVDYDPNIIYIGGILQR